MTSAPALLWRLLKYTRPYRRLVLLALLAWGIVIALDATIPQLIARAIDIGIDAGDAARLTLFAALAAGAYLVRAVFVFLHVSVYRYWDHRIGRDLRDGYYRKLMHLDYGYFDRANTGDLITRGISDVDVMRQWTGLGVAGMVSTLGMFAAMYGAMLMVNWRLALIASCVLPVLVLLAWWFARGAVPRLRNVRRLQSAVTNRLSENLNGVRVVRAYGREQDEIERFDTDVVSFTRAHIEWNDFWAWLAPSMGLVSMVGTTLVLGVGGLMVMDGGLTIGGLIAFNVYLARVMGSVRATGAVLYRLATAVTSSERFFAITNATPAIRDAPDAQDLRVTEGRIAFRGITLRYGAGDPVLDDVTFEIRPGTTTALVGPTGSGKSCIINLLGRFYDPTEGAVQIDGRDLRSVTLGSLRRSIGIVPQDVLLFADTIGRNVAFARPASEMTAIEAAATAAQAKDFIDRLPERYDTHLGERGTGLSGGQRQRTSIARAILPDTPILVLDDATSALDTETERRVLDAVLDRSRGRTVLLVAQRLTAARRADQILVIERGRITQRGTHEEVVAQPGLYRRLWREQSGEGDEPAEAPA